VLTPTRELALQVAKEIASLVPRRETPGLFPRVTAVYGGASIRNQILDLKRGTEIVVGTPGRVIDLMERKVLDLSAVDWFILDEADEMLDMGFFEDIEKILAHVKGEEEKKLRIALFSATMPEAILKVIREHIGKVEILEDTAPTDEKPLVDQFYMILKKEDRLEALRRVVDESEDFYGLVFCATKVETDELARRLVEGGYPAEAIHGDLSQEARERTLRRFRSRHTTILVATDVAARGLDIERLTHVINWDLPNDRDGYVHRVGRTGRAGRRGRAISLALPGDRKRIDHLSRSMEKILGSSIQWKKVPPVKSVMKAVKARIRQAVLNAAAEAAVQNENQGEGEIEPPSSETGVSPVITQLSRELVERLGSDETVTVLLSMAYGDTLDSSRYGTVTEIPELPLREEKKWGKTFKKGGKGPLRRQHNSIGEDRRNKDTAARVYVGLGRRHGASARDVAALLCRAGGVPGRLVDAIEMKDYCAFATMPAEAANRACAFSRNTPGDPAIRLASPKH
jgi:ATP-dependent RNA helicase DeaD